MRRFPVLVLIAITVAACSAQHPPDAAGPDTSHKPALFYAKDGSLYVSDPAGTPGRRLTDGPADTEPAPSPDGSRVAFVRKASRSDRGGQLWVLDLSEDSGAASAPRRLVDSTLERPRWSPAGNRIAFLESGSGIGGFLLTAAADTGAVQAPPRPLYAGDHYAWSPDGLRIAWTGGRSDVSAVDVNIWTVGESSNPVVVGTNATSVDFDSERRSVLFSNGDATGQLLADMPFKIRGGGVYASEPPPSPPRPLFSGAGSYDDVAALWRGAVGFTQWSADQRTKTIQVIPSGGSPHPIADTRGDAPAPAWIGNTVAYIGTTDDRPLLITTDRSSEQKEEAQQVDVGVDAFAWGD